MEPSRRLGPSSNQCVSTFWMNVVSLYSDGADSPKLYRLTAETLNLSPSQQTDPIFSRFTDLPLRAVHAQTRSWSSSAGGSFQGPVCRRSVQNVLTFKDAVLAKGKRCRR